VGAVTIRHALLALSALTASAAVQAQMAPPSGQVPPPVAEPWMAQPQAAPTVQPWQPRAPSPGRGAALEPVDLPPSIEQGVDMIYIDEDLVPRAIHDKALLHNIAFRDWSGAPLDMFVSMNPIYTDLRRGLMKYRERWGNLPDTQVPDGPTLKAGMTGDRVAALRNRLGLPDGDSYDAALAGVVKEFQGVHGLKADGIAGAGTIEALNRGPSYYEQLIIINMERARRLPAPEDQRKYLLVDAGSARLSMWENGKVVDTMKLVVGKAESPTPMMAAYIKYASVNPYWNVPPDLVRTLIGPRIVAQGISYLTDREYQVLSDFGDHPQVIDPATVDWKAVVAGTQEVALRRLPSPANSMGMMKFMLPNYFGIYLHDSPEKEHFTKNELWISNGCVRLEDYKRVAKFLFDGTMPKGDNPKVEKEVDLPQPVPVYMTYLTVQPTDDGVKFLADPYGRDAHLMERFGPQMMAALESNPGS
jgi:murein L,D-transpeptidase YcbB/YkuD